MLILIILASFFKKEAVVVKNLNAALLLQAVWISDLFSKYFPRYLGHLKTTIFREAAAILQILSSANGNDPKKKNKFFYCIKDYKDV